MLAYVHHFIVQVAAWRSGRPKSKLFTDYAVLGDDMVIGSTAVKDQYLKILSDLGVSCGLAKSILSPKGTGLEFAKRTFIDGYDVSPISLKEFEISLTNVTAWSAFVSKFELSWDKQAQILGHGFKARRKSFRHLNHALKVVHLALIAKSNFNSDTLRLQSGSPDNLNTVYSHYTRFRLTTLVDLAARVRERFTEFKNLPYKVKKSLTRFHTNKNLLEDSF